MQTLNTENQIVVPPFFSKWMGQVSYPVSLELQSDLVLKAAENNKAFILGLEHPKVVTLGKRADMSSDLKVPIYTLEDLGFQYFRVDRGGHATLHSPGQLVIYPIFPLDAYKLSVRDFVCALQKTTQALLKDYGISSFQKEKDPGLYTQNGKIAFFGIRVQKNITYHGLSLNVSNQLEDFEWIRSCGKDSEKFDKLQNYVSDANTQDLFKKWCDLFQKFI